MIDISEVPPDVMKLFFKLTFELINKGWKQYSYDGFFILRQVG